MCSVVVVAEENGPGHEFLGAENRVVGSQNFDPVPVALRTLFRTSAVSELGNDHGLAGKCGGKVIQVFGHCRRRTRSPASEIFICFDEVHPSCYVPSPPFPPGVLTIHTKPSSI